MTYTDFEKDVAVRLNSNRITNPCIVLIKSYDDDNVGCCDIEINNVPVTMLWCGSEVVESIKYMNESKEASNIFWDGLLAVIIAMSCDIIEGSEHDIFLNVLGITTKYLKEVEFNQS